MEYAILMPHDVDLLPCPERVRSAQNTEESTSCTLSTKIQPDSSGLVPTVCTHLRKSLRRIGFSESMLFRGIGEQQMEGNLGRFGDPRLEKGGPACWPAWSRSVSPALASAGSAAIAPARCALRASCATSG